MEFVILSGQVMKVPDDRDCGDSCGDPHIPLLAAQRSSAGIRSRLASRPRRHATPPLHTIRSIAATRSIDDVSMKRSRAVALRPGVAEHASENAVRELARLFQ